MEQLDNTTTATPVETKKTNNVIAVEQPIINLPINSVVSKENNETEIIQKENGETPEKNSHQVKKNKNQALSSKKPNHTNNSNNTNPNRKEHNGFLRNNNNNKNKSNYKTNTPFNNKSKFHKPKHSDNYIDNELEQSPTIISKEKELLFSLRNKIGFNIEKFKLDLDSVLKEYSFKDIKENEMNLLTYSILYSKEDVFTHLLNNYLNEFDQNDIEKNIANYSINKNPLFIKELLSIYESKYKSEDSFVKDLISKVCKTSYRFENNQEVLVWFQKQLTEENKEYFWNECLKEKNVVLFEHALTFEPLTSYLKENYNQFEEKINSFGKKHTVQKAFLGNLPTYIQPVKEIDLNVNSFISEDKISADFLPKTNEIRKDPNGPSVIIKKKRKLS